jgi:flagellar hook-associated protein 2
VALTQTLQAGSDAQIQLGSQANGGTPLTISSASNTVTNLIPGVTVTLQGADPNNPVFVNVANTTSAASQTITNFVNAFNAVIDYVNGQSTYDPSSQQAGPLLGNSSSRGIVRDLTGALNAAVAGVNAKASSLAAIGITFTATGDLSINSTTLNQALSGQLPGVSSDDVTRLFALDGTTSAGVSFLVGGNARASAAGPYGINITQPATQAPLTAAGAPLQSGAVIDANHNTLTLSLGGSTATLTLAENPSYTATSLAAALQSAITATPALNGAGVTVGVSNGNLQIRTANYGSGAITGGTALQALGFTAGQSATGTDVAGSFVVNGLTEPATGSGQVLTGNAGNANTAGLAVRSTLSAPTTSPVNVTVTSGLAANLAGVLKSYLDPSTGVLRTLNDQFNTEISDLQSKVSQQNAFIAAKRASLTQQFTAMETAISKLLTVQSQLTNQLAATTKANSNG